MGRRGTPRVHTHGMEIILRLTTPPGARLEGTVRRCDYTTTSLPFFGVLELLARIEQLTDDAPQSITE